MLLMMEAGNAGLEFVGHDVAFVFQFEHWREGGVSPVRGY